MARTISVHLFNEAEASKLAKKIAFENKVHAHFRYILSIT